MKIGLLGAGKVGLTIAAMLESCDFCRETHLADVRGGVVRPPLSKLRYETLDFTDSLKLDAFIKGKTAVVSAAPFYLNREIATACARHRVAYFDLTEDVETTAAVRRLAEKASVPFMPQCGLAPGAINIIGSNLAQDLPSVRSLELRVGALPLYASNSMKYYLSWNTAGLINEYCHLCDMLYGGQRLQAKALEGIERMTLDGTEYEAFYTSGGVGTLCETYEGKVRELNYKTIRYPGHRDLMKFLLYDLNLIDNRKLLTEIFDQEVPTTETDVVIIYVNVVGQDEQGVKQRSFAKKIYGDLLDGRRYSAIQLSTAAGLAAVLELYAGGRLGSGFVKQESVKLSDFLSTRWGGRIYAPEEQGVPAEARV
ncbi:MAG TPA: saccharopine dehydrogenase C-terminal domain-containing protein [Desulfobacterales bacterium]|jgi:saccharopine dehydrogenase-like NADP-dependent oxidoreductase|nr:saccharopine dehydrogenase C-terminal domain-containing protein [Desulfobacterales bacterium]